LYRATILNAIRCEKAALAKLRHVVLRFLGLNKLDFALDILNAKNNIRQNNNGRLSRG